MTLTTDEFIRRFLLHVLPKGFHRIRHYGLLASATRKANVARVRQLLAVPPAAEPDEPVELTEPRLPCPCCGGRMIIIETFQRWRPGRGGPPALPRINRDDDALTRHGSNLRYVVALSHRPSTPHAPGDALAPSITPIPHVIADLAHTRHWSSALFGRQNCRSDGPGQPGEHHAGNPHHTQLLKSP